MKWLILFLLFVPSLAFASERTELCFESYECSTSLLVDKPMTGILSPFDVVIPGFGILIVWGPIVLAIWILSKDALLTGIFGMIIAGTLTGLNQQAFAIGIMLFAASFGFALFTIFPRLKNVS